MKLFNQLLKILNGLDVEHIFGVPGDAINPLIEALREQDAIKFVHVAHEEAGAFAASAQAKLTGHLAVCAGTVGPGAIHLLNGLYDAHMDHQPVLAIVGQVPSEERGTHFHQEVDLKTLFTDVSVFVEEITTPKQMPRLALQACRAALEYKGVAVLVIPHNVGSQEVEDVDFERVRSEAPSRLVPDQGILDKMIESIKEAKKVAIFAGEGCRFVGDDVLKLAEKLKAPIIRSLKAKDIIPEEHENFVGGLGLLGDRGGVEAMKHCDLLLMLGTDFPYREWYNQKATIIEVNNSQHMIGRRTPNAFPVVGDCEYVVPYLLKNLDERTDDDLLKRARKAGKYWEEGLDAYSSLTGGNSTIHPQQLAQALSEKAADNTIFTCDTGAVTVWGARHLRLKHGQRFSLSFNLASMAYAMPASIGAQLAFPDRRVISLSGDGGLNMLMGDLLTLVKYKLPVKVVVFNNGKLGLIKMEQEVEGYPEHETGLHNPDYVKLAEAVGAKGFLITKPEDLDGKLSEALETDGPVIIDVHVNPDELTLPPKISLEQAAGFGLSKFREMLEG